jgi:CO dehydrogenase maturation factor
MRIAFVGKGGSGKTTLSALFAQWLSREGVPVLAIDADINQHLGVALGLDEATAATVPAMGQALPFIKDHLRATNPASGRRMSWPAITPRRAPSSCCSTTSSTKPASTWSWR